MSVSMIAHSSVLSCLGQILLSLPCDPDETPPPDCQHRVCGCHDLHPGRCAEGSSPPLCCLHWFPVSCLRGEAESKMLLFCGLLLLPTAALLAPYPGLHHCADVCPLLVLSLLHPLWQTHHWQLLWETGRGLAAGPTPGLQCLLPATCTGYKMDHGWMWAWEKSG